MKKQDNFSYSGMDFSDEFDFGDDGFGEKPKPNTLLGKSRQAVTDFTSGGFSSAVDEITNFNEVKNSVRRALPAPFSETWDQYDVTKKAIGDLYDHADKELSGYVGDIVKNIDKLVPDRFQRVKGFTTALKKRFEKQAASSEAQLQEQYITSLIGETFQGLTEIQQEEEQRREKRETARDAKFESNEQVRHLQASAFLSRIDRNIHRESLYNERVTRRLQQKTFELDIRKHLTLQNLLSETRAWRQEQNLLLKSIGKNTSLPDSVKETMTERFKESLSRRTMGSIQDRLFGQDSVFQTAVRRMTKDAKDLIDQARMGFMTAAMASDQLVDAREMIGSMSKAEILGRQVGSFGGGWLRNKGIKAVTDKIQDPELTEKIERFGYRLNNTTSDPRNLLREARKRFDQTELGQNTEGSVAKGVNSVFDYLNSVLKPEMGDSSLQSTTGLRAGMSFTGYSQATDNVVTKAIPSYLARILQQVTMANKPGQSVGMFVYDPMTGQLRQSSEMTDVIKQKLTKELDGSEMAATLKNLERTIQDVGGLGSDVSSKDIASAAYKLMTKMTDALSGSNILSSEAFEKGSDREREIFARLAEKIDEDSLEGDRSTYRLRKSLEESRRKTTSFGATIQNMVDSGLTDQLVEMGLVTRTSDGEISLNREKIEAFQADQIRSREEREGLVTSDVHMKGNISSYNPRRSLAGIRKIPIKTWNYLRDSTKRMFTAPMAQDTQRELGDEAAPGGRKMDLINMNGHTMGAVQRLAEIQDQMQQALDNLERDVPGSKPLGKGKISSRLKDKNPSPMQGSSTLRALIAIRRSVDSLHETVDKKTMLSIPTVNLDPAALQETIVASTKSIMSELNEKIKAGKGMAAPLINTGNVYFDSLQSVVTTSVQKGFMGLRALGEKAGAGVKRTGGFLGGLLPNEETAKQELRKFLALGYNTTKKLMIGVGNMVTKTIPEAISKLGDSVVSNFKGFRQLVKRTLNGPRDVYLPGQNTPVLLATKMRGKFYANANTGERILTIEDLVKAEADIIDLSRENEVALRWVDTAEGLYDADGNKLTTVSSRLLGLAVGAGSALARGAGRLLDKTKSLGSRFQGTQDSVKSTFNNMLSSFKEANFSLTDKRELGLLVQIRDLIASDKSEKVVRHVYNRQLVDESYLSGSSFLSMILGKNFIESMAPAKETEAFASSLEPLTSSGASGASMAPDTTTTSLTDTPGFQELVEKAKTNPRLAQGLLYLKDKFQKNRVTQWFGKRFGSKSGETPASITDTTSSMSLLDKMKSPFKKDEEGQTQITKTLKSLTSGLTGLMDRVKKKLAPEKLEENTEPQTEEEIEDEDEVEETTSSSRRINNRKFRKAGKTRAKAKSAPRRQKPAPVTVRPRTPEPAAPPSEFAQPMMPTFFGRARQRVGGGFKKMGGLKGLGAKALGGLGMLGSIGGSLLGGLFGGGSNTPERAISDDRTSADQFASTAPMVEARGKRDGNKVNDTDGDGYRDGSSIEMARRQQQENIQRQEAEKRKAQEARDEAKNESFRYKTENAIDSMLSGMSGIFGMVTKGLGSLFSMAGSFFGLKGIGKLLGKGFGAVKTVGKGIAAGAKVLGGGKLLSSASKGAKILRGVQVAAAASGMIIPGVGAAAMGVLGAAATALMSPIGLGIVAVAGTGYGLYKAYQYFTRNSLNDFELFRAMQYGLTSDSKDLHKVIALEEYLQTKHLIYSGNQVRLNTKTVEHKELLDIFDIDKDDQESIGNFVYWFNNRFLPFFLNACGVLNGMNNKYKLSDIEKLSAEQIQDFVEKTKMLGGPYEVTQSPFKDIESLPNTRGEVEKAAKVLKYKKPINRSEQKKSSDSLTGNPELLKNKQASLAAQEAENNSQIKTNDTLQKQQQDKTRQRLTSRVGAKTPGSEVLTNDLRGDDAGTRPSEMEATTAQTGQGGNLSRGQTAPGGLYAPSEGMNHLTLGKNTQLRGLHPTIYRNLLSMAAEYGGMTGKKIRVNEAFRSFEDQQRIYNRMPDRAAKPGSSLHEKGLAIDISTVDANALEKMGLLTKYGFTRPVGGETWHLEPSGIQLSIPKAKNDPAWASDQILASYGRGGGGFGSQPGTPLGRRNPTLARALFEAGQPIDPSAPPPKTAEQKTTAANDASFKLSKLTRVGQDEGQKRMLASVTPIRTASSSNEGEPSSAGQDLTGNVNRETRTGAYIRNLAGPSATVEDVVKKNPRLLSGVPSGNIGEQQLENKVNALYQQKGMAYGLPNRGPASPAATSNVTTRTSRPVAPPVVSEPEINPLRNQLKSTKPQESVTAIKDLANGITAVMEESLKIDAQMLDVLKTGVVPVLQSMAETLGKIYEQGGVKPNAPSSPPPSPASNPMRDRSERPAYQSSLNRDRKYG